MITPTARLLAQRSRPAVAAKSPGLRVVGLGGGTGLPILLSGLKRALFPPEWRVLPARGRDHLTAIVTVTDDGGSSGRLRQAYRVLAPGDVRNCLLALSDGGAAMPALFSYRFNGSGEMSGHSLGNLILTALTQLEGQFSKAIQIAGQLLEIRGRVLPATSEDVRLVAEFADGTWTEGESRIALARRPLRRVHLRPEAVRATPEARQALAEADLVVIGPGSLFTSIIPILLLSDLVDEIAASHARVALVMNLTTEPGETDGFGVAEHLAAIRAHAPRLPIHDVLLNAAPLSDTLLARYASEGASPIVADAEAVRRFGAEPWCSDLLASGSPARHDPEKLAAAVMEAWSGSSPQRAEGADGGLLQGRFGE